MNQIAHPLSTFSVPPGYYRIVVDAGPRGFGEVTRYLREDEGYALEVLIRPTADVVAGMVSIPGGPATLGVSPAGGFVGFERRRVTLEPFWIDRNEVTNGQYRTFLEETGRPPLPFWDNTAHPGWANLPVVFVSVEDATAYAAWAGKRLPTDLEWERAACGTDGRAYPWGSDESAVLEWANVNGAEWIGSPLENPDAARRAYEAAVLPADRLPEGNRDLNPAGLYHMLGNVAEWTESIPYTVDDVAINLMPGWRIIKGDNWIIEINGVPSLSDYRMHPTHVRGIGYGFRCAKSASP